MNIFDEIAHPHRHHDQEHTVTQQTTLPHVDSLRAVADDIAGNPLVARLLWHGLGRHLTAADADHVVAIISAIEQSRIEQAQPSTPPMPPLPSDHTQQTPSFTPSQP